MKKFTMKMLKSINNALILISKFLCLLGGIMLPLLARLTGPGRRASSKTKLILDLIAEGIGTVLFLFMAYAMIKPTLQSFATNQFDSEGTFLMPMGPFYVLTLFGAWFTFYAAIYNFIKLIVKAVKKEGEKE